MTKKRKPRQWRPGPHKIKPLLLIDVQQDFCGPEDSPPPPPTILEPIRDGILEELRSRACGLPCRFEAHNNVILIVATWDVQQGLPSIHTGPPVPDDGRQIGVIVLRDEDIAVRCHRPSTFTRLEYCNPELLEQVWAAVEHTVTESREYDDRMRREVRPHALTNPPLWPCIQDTHPI